MMFRLSPKTTEPRELGSISFCGENVLRTEQKKSRPHALVGIPVIISMILLYSGFTQQRVPLPLQQQVLLQQAPQWLRVLQRPS